MFCCFVLVTISQFASSRNHKKAIIQYYWWTFQINFATPVFDLSGVYSNEIGAIDELRTFENGLLKTEIDNGKVFPPSNPDLNPSDPSKKCMLNELPREKRCHLYRKYYFILY